MLKNINKGKTLKLWISEDIFHLIEKTLANEVGQAASVGTDDDVQAAIAEVTRAAAAKVRKDIIAKSYAFPILLRADPLTAHTIRLALLLVEAQDIYTESLIRRMISTISASF
jgi:hypothetical protein